MADNNVMFRTSMGGFNKADVMAYLDKQNADFRDFTNRQNAAIEEKDREIASLRASLEDAVRRAEAAEEKTAELSAQMSDNENLREKLREALEMVAARDGEIEELRSVPAAKCDSESERKAGLYDDMSSQVGDILISANKSADAIIAEAEKKAAAILDKAASDAADLRKNFSSKAARISAAVNSKTRAAADNYRADMKSELEQLKAVLSDAVAAVDEKSSVFFGMSDKLEERINSEAENAAAEMERETEDLRSGI